MPLYHIAVLILFASPRLLGGITVSLAAISRSALLLVALAALCRRVASIHAFPKESEGLNARGGTLTFWLTISVRLSRYLSASAQVRVGLIHVRELEEKAEEPQGP